MPLTRDLNYLKDIFPFSATPELLTVDLQKFVLLTMSALGLSRLRERPNYFRSVGPSAQLVNATNPVPIGKQWVIPYAHAEHDSATNHALRLGIYPKADAPGPDFNNWVYVAASPGSVGSSSAIPSPRTIILHPGSSIFSEVATGTLLAGEHSILGLCYWEIPAGEVMDFPS